MPDPKFTFTLEDIAGSSMPGRRFYKEYKTWQRIAAKCHNPKHGRYANYGGRGFVFDDFYRYSFLNFMNEVGECPEPKAKYTIERIDNDKSYMTGNMKWLVSAMQSINKTTNKVIEHKGKKQPLSVWCKDLGLVYNTISGRLRRGLTFEEAISDNPPKITSEVIYNGEILTVNKFCSELGLNIETVYSLNKSGLSGDEIAAIPEAYDVKKPKLYEYMGERMTLPQWSKRLGLNISTVRDKLKFYSFTFICDFYIHNKKT